MDTSRIEINITDNSTSLIENPTAVTGFTVVKAPKGPINPIRVSSGATATLKDIFGISSKDYPELFEVETFNREYDLWVSAPYTSASVPTAYITKDGVFRGSNNIEYNDSVEALINGDEESDIEGLTSINSNVECLLDTRFAKSQATLGYADAYKEIDGEKVIRYKASDLGYNYYPGFDIVDPKDPSAPSKISGSDGIKSVTIDLGLPLEVFAEKTGSQEGTTATYAITPKLKSIKIRGLNKDIDNVFYISNAKFDEIVGEGTTSTDYTKGYFEVYQKKDANTTFAVGEIQFVDDCGEDNPQNLIMYLYGTESSGSEGFLTADYVNNYLDQDFERKVLGTFFTSLYHKDDIYGVIIPKYPSERTLYIDFDSFSDTRGYSSSDSASRNILKMNVYEEGAFHNSSHKIHIEGSLVKEARNANGEKIGFTNDNMSYASQQLIFVSTIKTFTSNDIVNKNVTKFPSISLFGGTREFGESSTDLHNLGWKKAKDGDFSDVDIFFDSELHDPDSSLESLRQSTFFNLATTDKDNHELAGYYFNHTLSPAKVDQAQSNASYQLAFGRNYWNIDNQAIIMLNESGSKIMSPLTGAMSLMVCRIIEHRYGGVAPMWENQGSPSMGGQLRGIVDIYKLRYKYTKTQLDILDDLNYNPVINDRQYGFMVVGQKTSQGGESTDWSYIGHAAAFLNLIKEIRANVMMPQIGKANNPYYRTLRKEQVEQYLALRLEGNNRIWAWAEVDTSTADGVNDVYARKARKFVIVVRVMVDTFSEKVVLNFTNEDQSSVVSIS